MKQRGYALLLSVFVLLGLGGVWVAGVTILRMTHTADQTLAQSQARAALISYAVNYIDHYGVQGAGIGHLPCPDTDKPDSTKADDWHRDGPNPPCARQVVEHGWLPRHVTVRDGRYHFHSRSYQRLLYAVSGKFVNNPVGRIVNPSTESNFNFGGHSDVVAVLATPPLDTDRTGAGNWLSPKSMSQAGTAYSVIRTADIVQPAMQRVGGWLVGRLNSAMEQRCASVEEAVGCAMAEHDLSQCDLGIKFVLLHWLNTETVSIDCENHEQYLLSVFALFEEVPINAHWFVRNKWFDYVKLTHDQGCFNSVESDCRFVLLPQVDNQVEDQVEDQVEGHLNYEELIHVKLQPVSSVIE